MRRFSARLTLALTPEESRLYVARGDLTRSGSFSDSCWNALLMTSGSGRLIPVTLLEISDARLRKAKSGERKSALIDANQRRDELRGNSSLSRAMRAASYYSFSISRRLAQLFGLRSATEFVGFFSAKASFRGVKGDYRLRRSRVA